MPTFQPSILPAGAYRVSNKNHDYWIVDADGNIIGQTGANGQDTFFASYQTDSSGNVSGLLGPNGEEITKAIAGNAKSDTPKFLFIGDSTVFYGESVLPGSVSAATALNGEVTLTSASNPLVQVDDVINVSETGLTHGYWGTNVAVTAISGAGPYSYSYVPDGTPSIDTHPTPSSIAPGYALRRSSGGLGSEFRAQFGGGVEVINAGNGGDDALNVLTRLPYMLAKFNPTHVILTHGINDCYRTSLTTAQITAAYAEMAVLCKAYNATFEIVSPPPQPSTRSGWTTAKRDYMIALRAAQVEWCRDNSVPYLDWYSLGAALITAINPTDTSLNPTTNVIGTDNIHPSVLGNYLAGKALAAKYRTLYPTLRPLLPTNVLDGGLFTDTAGAGCVLMTGTGGTATAGAGTINAGSKATNVDIQISAGTATVTPYQTARTVANDGDALGNWQGVTIAAAAANDQVVFRLQAVHASVSNGDTVRVVGIGKIKTGFALVKDFSMTVISQTATTGNLIITERAGSAAQQAPHPEAATFYFDLLCPVRTPVGVHGAPSSFRPQIQVTAVGAGTIEVEIARFACRKV